MHQWVGITRSKFHSILKNRYKFHKKLSTFNILLQIIVRKKSRTNQKWLFLGQYRAVVIYYVTFTIRRSSQKWIIRVLKSRTTTHIFYYYLRILWFMPGLIIKCNNCMTKRGLVKFPTPQTLLRKFLLTVTIKRVKSTFPNKYHRNLSI